jgi:GH24 family phage-related lysozyme (muramidase)
MLSLHELKIVIDLLKAGEGVTTFLYQDSVGLVTIGVGNLVPNAEAAIAISLIHENGSIATNSEKILAYETIYNAPGKRTTGRSYRADYYASMTSLRMSVDEVDRLLARRIAEFYAQTKRIFPHFDSFPEPAKIAIMDMIFNLGYGKFNTQYVRFQAAVRDHDWQRASEQCQRSGPSEARNRETRNLFTQAADLTRNQQRMTGARH